jgi:hypothetical protein
MRLVYRSGLVSEYPRSRNVERTLRRELREGGETRVRLIETWSGGPWDVAVEDTEKNTTYFILKERGGNNDN